jgi:hypothetical protein
MVSHTGRAKKGIKDHSQATQNESGITLINTVAGKEGKLKLHATLAPSQNIFPINPPPHPLSPELTLSCMPLPPFLATTNAKSLTIFNQSCQGKGP